MLIGDIDAIPGAIGHIRSGVLLGLAVTSNERVKAMPTVPTIAQAGVPDYQINAFHGILAPAGTPPAIVARLEKDIRCRLQSVLNHDYSERNGDRSN